MANGTEDLQMLRLMRAFQKLTDQDTRRKVLLYAEEQVHQQQTGARVEHTPASECTSKSPPGSGGGTTGDS
ncbi:hypothetical protein ACVWZZ_006698 [Bradyrhizobium sp. LM6.10]